MRIDLVLLPGFLLTAVAVSLDSFRLANLVIHELGLPISPMHTRLLSHDGEPVVSHEALAMPVQGAWADSAKEVVMPFGVGMADPERLVCGMATPLAADLVVWLRAAHEDGAILAASCSSTFLLAQTGLLEGGSATTSWWLSQMFEVTFPNVELDKFALVTEHGRLLCAGAALAQLDLALLLIRRHAGPEVARACAQYLLIEEGRSSQAPFVISEHLVRDDPLIAEADRWIRERLGGPIRITELASALAVSPRTLSRRFQAVCSMSPVQFVQRCRAESAARLLRQTDFSIARVAEEVGYAEEGALRKAFGRAFDCSPSSYRRRLRQVPR